MSSLDLGSWTNFQQIESCKIIKQDQFSKPLKLIGGLDISFVDQGANVEEFEGVGALVVLHYDTLKPVYSDCVEMKTKIPYISGFLGFREESFAERLFERLAMQSPEMTPQVLLVDGCGIYHPQRFGSASQIGLKLNVPTIGVSKSFLKLDHIQENHFVIDNLHEPLDVPVIIDSNGEHVATALFNGLSKHPRCYVSIGHKISISTAVEIVKKVSISKIPEPIRLADLFSREYIRNNFNPNK